MADVQMRRNVRIPAWYLLMAVLGILSNCETCAFWSVLPGAITLCLQMRLGSS